MTAGWRMAYRYEGKSKLLSFGDYPIVSPKDAWEARIIAERDGLKILPWDGVE